ncbi:hypothetical protein [Gryllotalpicola koreensis]|uniref:Fimbrial assembly protein n=1 Tax=Gryllotalpicola koreensis TaxID=993086 RepID=A0ABP8A4N2_9MICO
MSTSELPAPLTELLAPPIETLTEQKSKRHGRRGGERSDAATGSPRASKPAKQSRADDLVLGGAPIARLLPPEVVEAGKARATRNLMVLIILGVLVLAGVATGAAYLLAQRSQAELEAIQTQNTTVLAQQAQYAPVRSVQNQVKLAQAAQRVGAASEIDWSAYFAKVQGVMPAGVSITAISGETASPTAAIAQDSAPLSPSRAATVTLAIDAPNELTIADALDALQKLPGYTAAVPGSITQGASAAGSADTPGGSAWSTTIVVSLNDGAFANRFDQKNQ